MPRFEERGPRIAISQATRVDKVHPRAKTLRVLVALVSVLVALIMLLPVGVMVISAMKTRSDVMSAPPKVLFKPTLEGFVLLLTDRAVVSQARQDELREEANNGKLGLFARIALDTGMEITGPSNYVARLRNSVIIAGTSTVTSVLLGLFAAYAFSRFAMKGKNDLLFFILSTRMLPAVVVTIPLFLMYRQLGLHDKHLGMIILYTVFNLSFSVWLLKGFIDEIPREYEEAALVDGYTRMQAFFKIVLPQAVSGIAATVVFCLIFAWNEFAFALMLTSQRARTAPVGIATMMGRGGIEWSAIAAGAVGFLIPVVIITFALRKYLLRGITFGAIRGRNQMATIELKGVEKKFGEMYAVKPLDLTIREGEFVVLLGPSGCGKTTTLRMISGLETVTAGRILLNGKEVTWRHPSERNMAFVFQFYALYSHLSVRQNIAFPLQAQGVKKEEIDRRVKEVVDMLRIPHLLRARPGRLAGGDQQRVALARALVRKPAAFLMDEPLGALDAELRESMRAEIKNLHVAQHATTVYVTHDQIEAMAMGDRIVVMSRAEVQQMGSPIEVYYNPANLFVARFIGSPGMNLVRGQLAGGSVTLHGGNRYAVPPAWTGRLGAALGGTTEVIVGFRPEAARVSAQGALTGEVYATDMYGGHTVLHVNLNENEIVHIRSDRQSSYPMGTKVRFDIDPGTVRFFDPRTERAVSSEAT